MPAFAICVFLSAFLLFGVQPVLGHYILPWFGGTPAVWTTCLLFFQVGLLGGYTYAHLLVSRCPLRRQGQVHACLLGLSLLLLPITPNPAWRGASDGSPTWHILWLLARSVGAPYLLLSATGPLLQGWFARVYPGRSPYRLYSLSNIGSLLALLAYPVLVEPNLRLKAQTLGWTGGFVLFVVLCAALALRLRPAAEPAAETPAEEAAPARLGDWLLWLALPACGSLLLLATTNQLCQDVAVVPFLWVLPLGLYLLSFIICFDHSRWYSSRVYLYLLGFALLLDYALLTNPGAFPLLAQIAGLNGSLFICCMVCHGELVKLRPGAGQLTAFYLMISLGGALAGLFVTLAAPRLFNDFYELQGGLALTAALFIATTARARLDERFGGWGLPVALGAVGGAVALVAVLMHTAGGQRRAALDGVIDAKRNFYGVLRVEENLKGTDQAYRQMWHGRIVHGMQFLKDDKRGWPCGYFGHGAGVGLALDFLADQPREVGIIGLGAGAIAAYAKPGDRYTYYEINPDVIDMCERHFTLLSDARRRGASVEVKLGDGRITLEREAASQPRPFDVFIVDAFSGDAIPTHLLTSECVELYLKRLKPGGLLAFHISNRYIDLRPIVMALATRFHRTPLLMVNHDDKSRALASSMWVLLSDDPRTLRALGAKPESQPWPTGLRTILWTDDFTNLYQVVQLR